MSTAQSVPTVEQDLAYLTENIRSSVEDRLMLRPSLEAALFKLGHSMKEIEEGLEHYYGAMRTVH